MSDAAYNLNAVVDSDPAVDDVQKVSRARPIPHVNVQAFCEDEQTAAVIQNASEDRRLAKANIAIHMGGAKAATVFYRDAPTPNLVIIESLLGRGEILNDLESLAEVCDPGTKVIVIGHINEVGLYRELLQLGVSEYVVAPIGVSQFIETMSSVYANPETEPVGQVIAFVGAKGGAGSSTVCHNSAFAISRLVASDTVIADLDLPFGTAGLDFNLDALRGVNDALGSPERLDEALLDRLLSRCSDHLSLLAAPIVLDHAHEVDAKACESVIDVMRKNLPWVAIDVPHLWTAWAREVLFKADHVVITAEPDLANLRNTKNLVDQLKRSRPNDPAPILVLNQVGLPKRPEIAIKDFGRAIELQPKIIVDFNAQLFGTAANNGQMIEEVSSTSEAAQSFRSLASLLTDRSEPASEHKSLLEPILSRLRLARIPG
jgi:pilus assembly protein CpaE